MHKLAQTCLIWNNLVSLSKISLMGHFSHSVFAKKYQFCIRIKKYWIIWFLNFTLLFNRPYLTETNKMHPKKLWPKLIFGTVIKPIEFSNISQNQPYLSRRGVQNNPWKLQKMPKSWTWMFWFPGGSNPHLIWQNTAP